MTSATALQTSLDIIDRGAFADWQGLSPAWSRPHLAALGHQLRSCRAHELGGRPHQRCEFPLPHQPEPLRCFLDAADQIVLLRLDDPRAALPWPALAQALGPPDEINRLQTPHAGAPATQFIYAHKGITLYVDESPDPAQSQLSAVSLYAPTTPQVYRQSLGGDETIEYLPDPIGN